MTSPLMALVARSVASSALAEDCTVVSGGAEHVTRATWVRREREDLDSGEITLESAIRVPTSDLPSVPVRGDRVRIGGRLMHVARALDRGPVYELFLTARPV